MEHQNSLVLINILLNISLWSSSFIPLLTLIKHELVTVSISQLCVFINILGTGYQHIIDWMYPFINLLGKWICANETNYLTMKHPSALTFTSQIEESQINSTTTYLFACHVFPHMLNSRLSEYSKTIRDQYQSWILLSLRG